MKILIISENDIVLYGLKQIIQNRFQKTSICCRYSINEALTTNVKKASFDVIVCEYIEENESWENNLKQIKLENQNSKLIVVTDKYSTHNMKKLFGMGVDGYIVKNLKSVLIGDAINLVLAGDRFIPAEFITSNVSLQPENNIKSRSYRHFSPRQIEVIKLVGEGLSNKKIAEKMSVKESTIKLHINSIFKILNVKNRTQALTKASALGIL